MSDLKPYETGYMKPPKSGQFKIGRSGNARGRPKQPETPYTALQKVLKRKVVISGEQRKVALSEALMRRLRDLVLSGDRRAMKLQNQIMEMAGLGKSESEPSVDILEVKERFMAMQKRDELGELGDGGHDE